VLGRACVRERPVRKDVEGEGRVDRRGDVRVHETHRLAVRERAGRLAFDLLIRELGPAEDLTVELLAALRARRDHFDTVVLVLLVHLLVAHSELLSSSYMLGGCVTVL